MADGVSYSLIGLDDLLGKLDTVTDDMKRRGGRFALRKAAQVVRDAAKAGARRIDDPQSPADIAENIAERWSGRTFKATGNLKFRVGVMGGAGGSRSSAEQAAGLPGGDTRHWRFVEFGTEHSRAQPFMRPALENNIGQATDTFITEYDKALGRALRRAKKRAGRA